MKNEDRDYQAEFQAFVDARKPTAGDYVLAVHAAKLVNEMWEVDPDLLYGWLGLNAIHFVTQVLGDQERSDRGRSNLDAPRSAFAGAAKRFKDGDKEALKPFDFRFVVSGNNVRRRLGDMTKADHLFVADEHEKRSNAARFEEAFHRAIAKRIPDGKTTEDVLSEEEYLRFRDSFHPPGR